MTKIRVGVFGAGRWGRQHLRVLTDAGADVVVCCTRGGTASRRWLAEHHPAVRVTADPAEAAAADVDAFVVATPRESHAELALAVLERGRHVLVEKPLGTSLDQVRLLWSAATAGRRALLTAYTHSYDPAFAALCAHVWERDAVRWRLDWATTATVANETELVWEYLPHVFSLAYRLDPSIGLTGAAWRGRDAERRLTLTLGSDRTAGTVRLHTGAPHRHKRLDLDLGGGAGLRWTDRRLDRLLGGVVSGDRLLTAGEPLRHQLDVFLAEASGDGPGAAAAREREDLAVTALLQDADRRVPTG